MILRTDEEQGLAFSVSPETGGELASLRVRWGEKWVELLHRAEDFSAPAQGHWRGRAPWLFPAVGRSYTNKQLGSWEWEGTVRPMPIHGFVMERAWEKVTEEQEEYSRERKPEMTVCRFRSGTDTRSAYPFDFSLTARYGFVKGGVRARLEVSAARTNAGPMPFSLGNHLSFALPFGSGSRPGDCTVRSPARERLELSAQGLLTGRERPIRLGKATALASEPDFCNAVLGGFEKGECWVEVADPRSFGLRISQSEVTASGASPHAEAASYLFVFYGSLGEQFFCPEPWLGGPNSLNDGQRLTRLEPGGRFEWEMTVQILR